ncbi:hypothetical protein SASPL_117717 [Salvia splendens]|uniref:Uncharacterized protein n=1 Tax=Salvia splendens TaxID=180675 RepID=A0A8X8ZY14_SALSN|nr:hypothetical protein SASPL_117717 [Salvia splendens]
MKSAISLLLLSLLIIHQAQGMGVIRKLLITSHVATISNDAKNENTMNTEKSSTAEQRPAAGDETYPGILDIAGMDYSQARRKPPIHN